MTFHILRLFVGTVCFIGLRIKRDGQQRSQYGERWAAGSQYGDSGDQSIDRGQFGSQYEENCTVRVPVQRYSWGPNMKNFGQLWSQYGE